MEPYPYEKLSDLRSDVCKELSERFKWVSASYKKSRSVFFIQVLNVATFLLVSPQVVSEYLIDWNKFFGSIQFLPGYVLLFLVIAVFLVNKCILPIFNWNLFFKTGLWMSLLITFLLLTTFIISKLYYATIKKIIKQSANFAKHMYGY